jgi:GTP-binding protein Era
VHNLGELQYVFLDTPGIHKPRTKLGDFMVKTADSSIGEADAVILVVEPRGAVGDIEEGIINRIKDKKMPAVLVVNKTDTANREQIAKTIDAYSKAYDFQAVIPISAKNNKGIDIVLEETKKFMRESMWYFPPDMITDQPERQIVAELIREKALRLLSDEIPHGIAVSIERMKERPESNEDRNPMIDIDATIVCERDSHKGIIIGKGGSMLKQIGTQARREIENLLDCKVNLQLWVKVKKDWRDSDFLIKNFGYNRDE